MSDIMNAKTKTGEKHDKYAGLMPKMSAKVVMKSKIDLQSDTPTDTERDPQKMCFPSSIYPNLSASNSE